ncbi:uncharacterized protein [Physcomitrium patens]|uniref:Uncharacterized protein n=1 Tax=Physcomitrium patens TaxID=3218 RepID=A0A2K1JRF1_PHYPA|nr:uncharacterized protein LOC112289321 isoform X1 [Physcomitrium patens]PNR44103.1 hypothetical protein PHYPA_016486 [Physcomitrium patens]|eukprot:XP_024390224.1 uncharacterized protein LOC112289321 isoform X1 [Physcomitrella patens]
MGRLKKMKQHEDMKRATTRNRDSPSKNARSSGQESQPGNSISLQRRYDFVNESDSHKAKVVQLNPKSTPMGSDDEQFFYSRYSSESSMISDKFPTSGAAPSIWEAAPSNSKEQVIIYSDMPIAPLMSSPSTGDHTELVRAQSLGANSDHLHPSGTLLQQNAGGTRLPSGLLYPCSTPEGNRNSCLLNAAHFTFDDNILSPDFAGISEGNTYTEKMFKELVEESKLNHSKSKNGSNSNSKLDAFTISLRVQRDEMQSPVSTLDCPTSPQSPERSFSGTLKRKSLRRRSDENNSISTQLPKSQFARYSMSVDRAVDDECLEGPSEVAWLEPSPCHPDIAKLHSTLASGRKNPSYERSSSNSSTWSISLVQNPVKSVSNMVGRRHQTRFCRLKDAIMSISFTNGDDGSPSSRSRAVKKGKRSEVNSGRSWLGSGRGSSLWACSGRLQTDVTGEPDQHELYMEQEKKDKNIIQQDLQPKADEEEFPFDYPIASTFVFQEAEKSPTSPAVVSRNSGSEDLQSCDHFDDPDDRSFTDSETSNTCSLDSGRLSGVLDYPSEYLPTRKIVYVGRIVDSVGLSNRALSGLSSRALSGFLEIGRSGRFSTDLQRGRILDKVQHPRTPDVRLRIFKSEKPSRRFMLSPCLPFLHRSNKRVPRIQQAPVSGSSRRLQPVNSFTARLGPVAENPPLLDNPISE